MSLFQMKPHFTEHKMGKTNLLLLFPKSGHNNNEPEHQACLCTASKCPSPAHADPGERDEEAARLEGEKAQNELSASGGDNPLLCSSFLEC